MSLDFNSVQLGTKIPDVVRKVDQEVINRFAVAAFDPAPIHIDPEWKKRTSGLPGGQSTIAHGQMTMGFITSSITAWAYPVMGRIQKIQAKYIRPVLPGDTITAGGTVTEKHFHGDGRNYVVLEIFARNHNDEPVAVGEAEVVLP